jgi:hypothetical protein
MTADLLSRLWIASAVLLASYHTMIFSGSPFSCWRDEMSKKKHASMPSHGTWGEAFLLASVKENKDEMNELIRQSQKDDAWKQERLRDNNILYILDAFLP